jgi:uncharacterized membrane protein
MRQKPNRTRLSLAIGAIGVIDVAGIIAAVLTGNAAEAASLGMFDAFGQFFYQWWAVILPASVMFCMLSWDLASRDEEADDRRRGATNAG